MRRQSSQRARLLRAALLYGTLVVVPTVFLAVFGLANITRVERDLMDSQSHQALLSLETIRQEITARIEQRMGREEARPYYEYNEAYRPAEQITTNPAYVPNNLRQQRDGELIAWFQLFLTPGERTSLDRERLQLIPDRQEIRDLVLETWRDEIGERAARPTERWGVEKGQVMETYPLEVIGANRNFATLEPRIQSARRGNTLDNDALNSVANAWINTQRLPAYADIPTYRTTFHRVLKASGERLTMLALREVAVPGVDANGILAEQAPAQLLQGLILDVDRVLAGILARVTPLLRERGITIRAMARADANEIRLALSPMVGVAVAPGIAAPALVAHLDRSSIAAEIASRRGDLAWLLAILASAVVLTSWLFFRSLGREWRLVEQQRGFVSAVTHELRTPVAGIRLYADLLEEGWVRSDDQRREYFATLKGETHRLEKLVDDVLHVAAFDRGEPRVHPGLEDRELAETLRESVDAFRTSPLGTKSTVELEGLEALGPVPHDRESIRRILFNLLENAAKYTPPDRSPAIRIRATRGPRSATVLVADNARGIPGEHQRRIFEDFYRIGSEERRSAPGAGLGLGVVRRHVEAHGGRIEIASSSEVGTSFRILIPL